MKKSIKQILIKVFPRHKSDSLTRQIMKKLIFVAIGFYLICIFIFAVLPEFGITGITGGWDWLSFVGSLVGTLFACWGVITTIESTQELTHQQAILSAKPMLNVTILNCSDISSMQNEGVFLNYSINERSLSFDKAFFYLSDVPRNYKMGKFTVLRVKNIGLGAAVKIQPKFYKAKETTSARYKRIENDGTDDVYRELVINPEAKAADYSADQFQINDNFFYEIARFHLNNDFSYFDIVLKLNNYSGEPAHFFLRFTYEDMFGESYEQFQYLLLTRNGCRPHHISSQAKISINKEK